MNNYSGDLRAGCILNKLIHQRFVLIKVNSVLVTCRLSQWLNSQFIQKYLLEVIFMTVPIILENEESVSLILQFWE